MSAIYNEYDRILFFFFFLCFCLSFCLNSSTKGNQWPHQGFNDCLINSLPLLFVLFCFFVWFQSIEWIIYHKIYESKTVTRGDERQRKCHENKGRFKKYRQILRLKLAFGDLLWLIITIEQNTPPLRRTNEIKAHHHNINSGKRLSWDTGTAWKTPPCERWLTVMLLPNYFWD